MEFKPNGLRLLTEKCELEQKTASGIILATMDEDDGRDTCFAKVVAVGLGKYYDGKFVQPVAKVGDIVVYKENMPLKFKHGQYLYDIIDESNVLMTVSGDDVTPVPVGTYEKSKSDVLGKGVKFLG
jgi:co-chaperonin GroES (HSP10)